MFDRKEYMKKWHLDHPGYMKQYGKQRHLNHKKTDNEKAKQWYLNHLGYAKEYKKQWYLNHKESVIEKSRQRRFGHPEYNKQWYLDHKEERAEYCKQRNIDHPEYNKQYRRTPEGKAAKQRGKTKRRAQKRELINTLTAEEWIKILKEYKFKCAYCGCEFTLFDRETRDHVIPVSKGGDNTKENIVPACQSCNSKKHNKILEGGL